MGPGPCRWGRVDAGIHGQSGRQHAVGPDRQRRRGATRRLSRTPLPTGRLTEARILGVRVDCLGMGATLGRIEQFVDEGGTHLVATVNPEFVMRAQQDREFARVLESAGLCLPDGMGVVWAARRQGCALRETVSGVDLIQPLAAMCARRGFRLFLLGAAPGVAGELAATLRLANPTLEVASHSGGPEPAQEAETLKLIHEHGSQVLLVAFGAPAQELWIDRLRNRLGVAVPIGAGGVEGLPHNRGKGRALAVGVEAATGGEVLITDADLSTPIEELEKLQAALRDGAGVAIGSRALRASRVEISQPVYRVLMGKAFNLIVQAVLLPGIWDTQCGFKLFRADVAHSVFAGLATDGFGFDPEVLYRARKKGVKIAEVPVVWRNSAPTKVSPVRSSLDMLKHVIRLRLRG